jgi:hypothetical protein
MYLFFDVLIVISGVWSITGSCGGWWLLTVLGVIIGFQLDVRLVL